MNKKRWSIKPLDTDLARKLAQETGKNHVVAKLLAQRGFTTKESIEDFLSPPLGKMPNSTGIPKEKAGPATINPFVDPNVTPSMPKQDFFQNAF